MFFTTLWRRLFSMNNNKKETMKKTLFRISIVCAACSMLSLSSMAQSGSQSDQSGSQSDQSQSTQSQSQSDQSSDQLNGGSSHQWSGHSLGATGRSEHAIRASKLIGATVKDSSGSQIGEIQDAIVSPTSGKISCVVISRSEMGGASTPSGTSSGTSEGTTSESQSQSGTTSTLSSSSSGQLVPVPWSLLKPSSSGASMSGGEQSFTLNVEKSKLDQAPTLSQNRLSELGQPGWTQRINSYYGVSGESSSSSSMGGAETPSGTMKGAGSSDLLNPNISTNSNSTGSEQY
jgi:sporulation protein YlmC with PRC-barrel domain